MVSYNYSSQNRQRWQMNTPPSRAISMVMAVCQCNTERIAQCSMTSASPEPPGAAIGGLIALYRLIGRQGDNQHNDNATCTHFAGRFYDHRAVAVLYRAHHPMEEVRGFHKTH